MSGKLLQQARKDLQKVLSGGSGWEEDISITDPAAGITVIVKGLHPKHWISYDTDGNPVNSKSATINIMENDLVAAGITTRNERTGNIDLYRLHIGVADATGIVKNYKVNETFPSETFGCIIIVLGDLRL